MCDEVWTTGDLCLAPFSEDGENEEYYEARIEKIIRLPGTRRLIASVAFIGYEDDEQEAFDINKLKRIERKHKPVTVQKDDGSGPSRSPSTSLHLFSQDAEKLRIKRLYDDDEYEDESSLTKQGQKSPWLAKSRQLLDSPTRSPSRKTSQKNKVAKGGKVKKSVAKKTPEVKVPEVTSSDVPTLPADKLRCELDLSQCHIGNDSTSVSPAFSNLSGFSDEDLEKPRFSHVPCGKKVPYVLSADGELPVIQIPATINQYLRDYQREGIQFLYKNFSKGQGAILGDDMGLGKTVQVIGFISAILKKTGTKADVMRQIPKFIRRLSNSVDSDEDEEESSKKTFLIIGPASVLYNWVDEFETWGYFRVGKFHQSHKEETLAELEKGKLDVVITTFETCRDNLGQNAEITKALKRLRCKCRYGLSGTVLQNDMKELWCVLDWAIPGCLGSIYQFEAKFEKVISKGQKRDASKRELAEARKAKEAFSKLRTQWMLRRTKALIAHQLPTKDQKVVYCQPTSFQVSVYKAVLGHDMMKAVLTQNHPCPCDSGRSRGKCCHSKVKDADGKMYSVRAVTMSFMHLLIKVANHVALLLPCNTDSEEQQKRALEICTLAFSMHPQFLQQSRNASFRTLSDPQYCGKMKVLCGLLSVFKKENSKVLIFSLSTRLLDILEQYIISKGYEYRRLDGKTPNVKRTQLVREFNKESSIFLFIASTKAGGVGLNLTGANVVIIFDPNWNPSHDLQAEDRAYRIGQGRNVRVFRLICSGTIEEIVYLRQVYKQQLDKVAVGDQNAKRLFHGVQGDKSNTGELFGMSNLFKLREGPCTLTADILARNEQAEAGIKGFKVSDYIPPEQAKKSDEKGFADMETDEEDSDALADEDKDSEEGDDDEKMYGTDYLMTQIFDDEKISEGDDDDTTVTRTARTKRNKSQKRQQESDDSSRTSARNTQRSKRKTHKRIKPRESDSDQDDDNTSNSSTKTKDTQKKNKTVTIAPRANQSRFMDQSFESLGDVFRDCGVVHTHDNRHIVGPSRAEDYMSRCAMQDVYELHQNSQMPALHCSVPLSSSDESDDLGPVNDNEPVEKTEQPKQKPTEEPLEQDRQEKPRKSELPCSKPRTVIVNSKKILIGQTPKAVIQSHMQDMMIFFGYKSLEKFAEQVVCRTTEEHQRMLQDFYVSQDKDLAAAFTKDDCEISSGNSCKRKVKKPTKATEVSPNKETKTTSRAGQKRKGQTQKSKPPQKRATSVKGCQFSSISDDEDSFDANGVQTPQTRPFREINPQLKARAKFEKEFDKIFGLDETSQSSTNEKAKDIVADTETLIDDLLDASHSVKLRSPRKHKNQSRVTKSDSPGRLKVSNDTLAIIDELFLETSKAKAPPKRKNATLNADLTDQSTSDILDFLD